MPVPSPFRAVHGVFGKDAVEHVCGVDLGGEVAVVTCIVPADEMAEGGFAVAC